MFKKGLTLLGFVLFLPVQIYAANRVIVYCLLDEKYLYAAFAMLCSGAIFLSWAVLFTFFIEVAMDGRGPIK
jgi:hypothetical protein